jgi:hypothetical protein
MTSGKWEMKKAKTIFESEMMTRPENQLLLSFVEGFRVCNADDEAFCLDSRDEE